MFNLHVVYLRYLNNSIYTVHKQENISMNTPHVEKSKMSIVYQFVKFTPYLKVLLHRYQAL